MIANSLGMDCWGMDCWNIWSLNSQLYFNPINGLWESIKYLTSSLLTCCLMLLFFFLLVSLGYFSFNQKRWDSLLSEKCYETSFTSDKVECSYLSFRSNIWEGWRICVSVPFVRTGPNKLLLASNLSCHKQFRFPCWLPQPLSRIFLCVSLWYDSLQQRSRKELLFLLQAKFLSLDPNNLPFPYMIWEGQG